MWWWLLWRKMKQGRRIERDRRDEYCLTVHKVEQELESWGWSLVRGSCDDCCKWGKRHPEIMMGQVMVVRLWVLRKGWGLARSTQNPGAPFLLLPIVVCRVGRSRVIWSPQSFLLTPAATGRRAWGRWTFLPMMNTEVSWSNVHKLALKIIWWMLFVCCSLSFHLSLCL